jgi:hypothetical protein
MYFLGLIDCFLASATSQRLVHLCSAYFEKKILTVKFNKCYLLLEMQINRNVMIGSFILYYHCDIFLLPCLIKIVEKVSCKLWVVFSRK